MVNGTEITRYLLHTFYLDISSLIKRQIEENRNRYESCIKGSTDKMLKFANQLRVIDIEESNFKHDDNYANAKPIWT